MESQEQTLFPSLLPSSLQFVSVPGNPCCTHPPTLPQKNPKKASQLYLNPRSSAQNRRRAPSALWVSIWFGGYFHLPDADQPPRSGAEWLEQHLYLQNNLETNAKPREQTNKLLFLFTACSLVPVSTGNCSRIFHFKQALRCIKLRALQRPLRTGDSGYKHWWGRQETGIFWALELF